MEGKLPPFKAILWDKDGTLLDNFSAWITLEKQLAQDLAQEFQLSDPQAYTDQVLKSLGVRKGGRVSPRGLLATGTETSILGAFYQALPLPCGQEDFLTKARNLLNLLMKENPPLGSSQPGALDCLNFFYRQKIPQGLATADTLAGAQRDLERLGAAQAISYWACADQVPFPKPHPWSVHAFAHFCGLEPHEVLVIGDSPPDQTMAQKAGAPFCGLLCGVSGREDFAPGTVVADHPGQIKEWQERA